MKILILLLAVAAAPLLTSCSSAAKKQPDVAVAISDKSGDGKAVADVGADDDDLDEYAVVSIADPLEKVNRGTFWLNHGIYTYLIRPVSKVYRTIVPKPVRQGLDNAYQNVAFPVRVVNHTLQGNLPRAGQETGKFLVNSTVGVGGFMRPSDRIPALANVPSADTGQTFARWGIGHGYYLVLPILGPSSVRETVGYAGDYALNPVNWVTILYGGYAWTLAIPYTNTVRSTPGQMDQYDAAIGNAVDPYLAARSSFVQYRAEVARRAIPVGAGTVTVSEAPAP